MRSFKRFRAILYGTVIGHQALNGQSAVRRTPLWLRLWFYIVRGLTNALWKNSASMANCGIHFFDCHHRFSLVKAAMNAARICKMRNGVSKTPSISSFFKCQRRRKTIAHLSIAEGRSFWSLDMRIYDCKLRNEKKHLIQVCNDYSPQLSKLLYNCKLKNKEALKYFKRLSEVGGRADFSKNLPRLSI